MEGYQIIFGVFIFGTIMVVMIFLLPFFFQKLETRLYLSIEKWAKSLYYSVKVWKLIFFAPKCTLYAPSLNKEVENIANFIEMRKG